MNASRTMKRVRFFASMAAATVMALVVPTWSAVPASAQSVSIYVNGQLMHFDQPPIERSGRVFVPLRGVFERLGASVVYDNGIINCTGSNGATVHLTIGSHNAIVNGNSVYVDVAPYTIGGRTLVPLRFVSQSLGASVNYDYGTHVVTINGGGAPAASVSLVNLRPGSGASVSSSRPSVSGGFSTAVDPNSVHITLDGRDVSSTSYVSSSDFLFTPPYSLPSGSHSVRVTGRSQAGVSFDQSWSFYSGSSTSSNYLQSLSPADGSSVNGNFTLTGRTLPNSRVHIAAVASAVLGMFRIGTGAYTADVTADSSGAFSQSVSLNTVSGGNVSVRVTSTAPTTQASAVQTLTYHT